MAFKTSLAIVCLVPCARPALDCLLARFFVLLWARNLAIKESARSLKSVTKREPRVKKERQVIVPYGRDRNQRWEEYFTFLDEKEGTRHLIYLTAIDIFKICLYNQSPNFVPFHWVAADGW
jgi:hypothetical protein